MLQNTSRYKTFKSLIFLSIKVESFVTVCPATVKSKKWDKKLNQVAQVSDKNDPPFQASISTSAKSQLLYSSHAADSS